MKEFIKENPDLISDVLKGIDLPLEKLEMVKQVSSNENFNFKFTGSCPGGFHLETTVRDSGLSRVSGLSNDLFKEYLIEKNFYPGNFEVFVDISDRFYKAIISKGMINELRVHFYISKQ